MTIQVGDRIPSATLGHLGDGGMTEVNTETLLGGAKVVLFGVPGAFTPTCNDDHLPGYLTHAAAFKAKGVERVVCMAVNDPFVMAAWGTAAGVGDAVFLLPDGSGAFTKALGLEFDLTELGLGVRCKRFAMIIDGGVVRHLAVEDGPGVSVSGAEQTLAAL